MGRDSGVEQRLGEGWLIPFVMAPAPVAYQVDQEVLVEAHAIGMRQTNRGHAGFWLIRVDMDDRDLEALREVAGVQRRAPLGRSGGESDLIIDDDVDRS